MILRAFAPLVLFVAMARPMPARADAPLAQIALQPAYADVAAVDRATKNRVLDKDAIDLLHSAETPIDVKVAVVNALGVSFDPSQLRADAYTRAVYGKDAKALDKRALRGDELLVVGHLLALDDAMTTTKAAPFLEAAQRKLPTSFTVALVVALARQVNMSTTTQWCGLWRASERVLRDAKLVTDMREGAIDLAFDFLVNFRDSCPGARLRWGAAARGARGRVPSRAAPPRGRPVQRRQPASPRGAPADDDRTVPRDAAGGVVRERRLRGDRSVDRDSGGAPS